MSVSSPLLVHSFCMPHKVSWYASLAAVYHMSIIECDAPEGHGHHRSLTCPLARPGPAGRSISARKKQTRLLAFAVIIKATSGAPEPDRSRA
jgi:hypothetical protein